MLKKVLRSLGLSQSEECIGSISEFAGSWAPRGFAFCSGQVLSVKDNAALFSILGTKYGGDGINNFALPDLRPTDKNGAKINWDDWKNYNGPVKVICIEGYYPSRW